MVNVLREYRKGFNRALRWDKFLVDYAWNFYTGIHPKSESQYRVQQFLAGFSYRYNNWMVARSLDERNRVTREQYGIRFGDITYPWLSGLTSANESKSIGSATWTFSENLTRLYR